MREGLEGLCSSGFSATRRKAEEEDQHEDYEDYED